MATDVLNGYLDQVLAPIVENLQSMDPVAYGDHQNAWIDLGWDISSGDGEIVDMALSILHSELEGLPDSLKHWLWWQTFNGQYEAEACIEFLSDRSKNRMIDDFSDLEATVKDVLSARLLLRAEEAYDEYLESQDEEDEEDWAGAEE